MHSAFKFILTTMGVLLLNACASAPEVAPVTAVKHIKRLAVVSTVGSTFTRTYVGATVFGNEKHVRPFLSGVWTEATRSRSHPS